MGASWLVGGLVGGWLELRTGWVASRVNVVAVLGLSSSSTTTWESIYCDSSLVSGLFVPSSSSLLSSLCSRAYFSILGSSGSRIWLALLKGEFSINCSHPSLYEPELLSLKDHRTRLVLSIPKTFVVIGLLSSLLHTLQVNELLVQSKEEAGCLCKFEFNLSELPLKITSFLLRQL